MYRQILAICQMDATVQSSTSVNEAVHRQQDGMHTTLIALDALFGSKKLWHVIILTSQYLGVLGQMGQ